MSEYKELTDLAYKNLGETYAKVIKVDGVPMKHDTRKAIKAEIDWHCEKTEQLERENAILREALGFIASSFESGCNKLEIDIAQQALKGESE